MRTNFLQFIGLIFFVAFIFGCKEETNNNQENYAESVESPEKSYYENGELEVITNAMEFITADTINSGWNRILYTNNSPEVHFIILDKFPSDSIDESDIKEGLLPPFDEGMAFLMKNQSDSAMAAFGRIPSWFNGVKRYGGTGLISPGQVADAQVRLDPGKYMMECYVKMANGEWHTSHGMWKFITVLEEPTTRESPNETVNTIKVSSKTGYTVTGNPASSTHNFKVEFEDQVPYEHFSGHDVNLVRYEEGAVMDSLVAWLNWMRPTGLRSPSPNGFTFLGGMNNCEAGEVGYFTAELTPGNYVFISETPEADKKGLFKTFEVK